MPEQQLSQTTERPNVAVLPPVSFAVNERQVVEKQVETITTNVVNAIRNVIQTAQDLEELVVQNAARVKTELDEHIDLAAAVSQEAAKLGGIIKQMRAVQAELAVHRKAGGNGRDH